MKRVLSALLTVAMLLGLCACGGPTYDESLLGVYTCYAVEMLGVEMKADEVLSSTSTLELKQGGKGKMSIEGTTGSIKYTLSGEDITVDVDDETAKGTLKDGVLHIELMGMNMYFIQEGKEIPVTTPGEVGYYTIETLEDGGETLTKADLEAMGMGSDFFYLVMEEDGTAYLVVGGEDIQYLTWADGKLTDGKDSLPYVLNGDTLTLVEGSTKMTFTRSDGTPPPKPAATSAAPAPESTTEAAPAAPDAATSEGDPAPVSADLGDYHVDILGAESFKDSSDKDAIRVYIDFTNNSTEPTSFFMAMNCEAYQEGFELVSTYAPYDQHAPEDGNSSLDIMPGTTIRCIREYNYKADGGIVEFTLQQGYNGDTVTMKFDPKALQGRPAEDYSIQATDSSAFVDGLPSEGVYKDDYAIKILNSEVVDGWEDGTKLLRVYFEFTNNSQEATSFWMATYLSAMQDNIQLTTSSADASVPEDDNDTVDIQPGETITATECFVLHDTGSKVAVKVVDSFGGSSLGAVFNVQ